MSILQVLLKCVELTPVISPWSEEADHPNTAQSDLVDMHAE
jgi:hypothetical protein